MARPARLPAGPRRRYVGHGGWNAAGTVDRGGQRRRAPRRGNPPARRRRRSREAVPRRAREGRLPVDVERAAPGGRRGARAGREGDGAFRRVRRGAGRRRGGGGRAGGRRRAGGPEGDPPVGPPPRGGVAGAEAGVDALEHGFELDDETATLMAANGVRLVSTLCVLASWRTFGATTAVPRFASDEGRARVDARREAALASVAAAHRAGVAIATGTDFGGGSTRANQLAWEVEQLVEAGLAPWEALGAATWRGGGAPRGAEGRGGPEG